MSKNKHNVNSNFDINNNKNSEQGDFLNKELLFKAISEGDLELVKSIIEPGLDIHNIYFEEEINNQVIEKSLLDLAIEKDRVEITQYFIEECNFDVNELDYNSTSLLLTALANEQYEIAEVLIDKGIDINKVNIDGWSALHFTIFYGYTNLFAKITLVNGADINLATKEGVTQLHLAVLSDDIYFLNALIDKGVNKDVYDENNESPYQLAQKLNKLEYVRVLRSENNISDNNNNAENGNFPTNIEDQESTTFLLEVRGNNTNDFDSN